MTFTGDAARSIHDFELNVNRNTPSCEQNITTQFESAANCGNGINDRITSDGEGRVTSEGECRIIA